jgi:hypothetical protein
LEEKSNLNDRLPGEDDDCVCALFSMHPLNRQQQKRRMGQMQKVEILELMYV